MEKEFHLQLTQSRIEVQELTYQHIGKELHDNVGQLLSTSRMLLGLTERSLPAIPDTLLTANETLARAINELRSLSRSLDKEWLEQFSFADNLEMEIDRINAGGYIAADYHQEIPLFLRADEQIILFRIVQEAIQNAIRHGLPHHIFISVSISGNDYLIAIKDDGHGNLPEQNTGMGMLNMKHRTNLLGGEIHWHPTPGKGTTVVITLPVKQEIV